jgi:TolB-like protein
MGKGYRFVGPITEIQQPERKQPEIQPEMVQPALGEAPATAPRKTRPLLWWAASAVLALLIVGIGLRARSWGSHAKLRITSLAVLPLDNLSGDRGQEYFADGMTDELTTMLAKNSTLRVVSRTSAMQYKGAHRPLREIAEALGVDGILEGSVERSGDKVHMTIQLIHAPSDTHLWAESYDRNTNDVVTLPEDAAQAIAKRLNASLAATRPARYVNPEAHDAYLQGKFHLYTSADGGGAYFKKAVQLQPDYAPGWAGLAGYYGSGAGTTLDPKQVNGPFMAAAQKSVDLDDSLPEAHVALGAALFYTQWNWAAGEREMQRAIQLDPENAEAHHRYAEALAVLNSHQEALAEQKKATELDPFARPRSMALLYQLARQYDTALADLKQRLAAKPDDDGLVFTLVDVYRCKGMYKESVEAAEHFAMITGQKAKAEGIRRAYARGGYEAVLRWRIADAETRSKTQYVSPVRELAYPYAQLGQRERTLELLEEGFRDRDPNLLDVQNDPAFDFLHNDERYRSLIRRIGLPPAW